MGRVVHNDIVLISNVYNAVPFFNCPIFSGRRIYIGLCAKDFPHLWLRPDIFPNAERIYLNMEPHKRKVIDTYNRQKTTRLYISGNLTSAEHFPGVEHVPHSGDSPTVQFMNPIIMETLFDHVRKLPMQLPITTPQRY